MLELLEQLKAVATAFGVDWAGLFVVLVLSYCIIRLTHLKAHPVTDALQPLVPVLVGVGWSCLVTVGAIREVLFHGLFVGAVAAVVYKLGKPAVDGFLARKGTDNAG